MKCESWTEKEIEILHTFYLDHTAQECIDEFGLNRTIKALQKKARELGIRKNKKWSKEEEDLLKFHWENSDMETLLRVLPDRTYSQMMNKAKLLKVTSKAERKRQGSLDFLDNLTEKSSYWWGFIMADGHLSPRGELYICLSGKDSDYLKVLAKHLKCKTTLRIKSGGFSTKDSEFIDLRIQDKKFQEKWYSILDYTNPKTYNPPKLDIFYNKKLLIYFLIGLIDGDGSIWISNCTETSKGSISLRIEVHPNWEERLRELISKIEEFYNIKFNIKTSSKGYIKAEIASKKDLEELYKYIDNCDYMARKWDKVKAFTSQ
ncbi:LAGLIDADG family homing endonuclease [Intestinibacter sp.]|uniref:LAGLIDADG family homing endonuclease n=1 Tax=Intestinibacter sp. TaxID=1965304 RepID=UPI003F153A30